MGGSLEAVTWVALVAGILAGADGAASLIRRQVTLPWLRRRFRWRPHGWGQVLFGLFTLLETVPRLASGSDLLIMVFSVGALIPLAAAALLMRAEPHAPDTPVP
jgi:hypothetical protein